MTIQIIKVSVTQQLSKLYNITLNLKLLEGEQELLSRDFSERYRVGQNITEVVNNFKEGMQAEIDNYKAEQNLFTAAQLDTAIDNLKNSLSI